MRLFCQNTIIGRRNLRNVPLLPLSSWLDFPSKRRGTAQTHWLRHPTNLDPRRSGLEARLPLRASDGERSGHCAVVDGNFLYVWGGYVNARREPLGPSRSRGSGLARPALAVPAPFRWQPPPQPRQGLTLSCRCFHF
ncbi:hypothetical protein P7K49_018028 [Saguinus oedipus]|uniref:Uncharacterized protein n=1 Tax=Saguinus oedipus TaxID=9490 RepID=A0ABQ9V4M4_SAGOE|nr:hypothetical protein P7K49_018028 [Saguinus oedipus]